MPLSLGPTFQDGKYGFRYVTGAWALQDPAKRAMATRAVIAANRFMVHGRLINGTEFNKMK